MAEAVNHPAHYQAGGLEAITVIEAFDLGFCLGNTIKYILHGDAPVCTGTSAQWCPVCGDCKCPDRELGDLSDRDCPLHSSSSDHATRTPTEEET